MIRQFLAGPSALLVLLLACASTTADRLPVGEAYSDTLQLAVRLSEERDLDGCVQELQRIVALPSSPMVKIQAYWRLYLVHRDRGESLDALQALVSCLERDAAHRSSIYGRARSSLGPAVVDALAADISWATISNLLGGIEEVELTLDLVSYLTENEDCYPASILLGKLARQGLDAGDEQRRTRLAKKVMRCMEKTRPTLALVVPLTGDYAEYGSNLARGAELALLDSASAGTLILEKIDSGSDPVEATLAMSRLARSPHVIAVIGPLQSRAATGAAMAVTQGELPNLVPLPAPQGLSRFGKWVFQSAVPIQAEARTVAKYAMIHGGISRFAILYPSHATGERAMDAFKSQVYDLGGEVVAIERYSEDRDTDFRTQIVNIKRASPQALFVPGQPRELIQIARQVAFYELECQLLGTDGWSSTEVIARGGRLVEGVIFSDLAGMEKNTYAVDIFRATYQERFARDPDHYAYIGFDLASCVRKAVENGRTTRDGLRRYLEGLGPIMRVSGVLSWRDEDTPGAIQLLTIADGLVVPLPMGS